MTSILLKAFSQMPVMTVQVGHLVDWFYFNWSQDWSDASNLHINEKEVIAVTIAAYCWAPCWQNKHVLIYSDNTVTVSAPNKGTCRNETVMKCIRSLFWFSAKFNFHLTARFCQGPAYNMSASCLDSPGYLETLLPSSFAHVAPNPPFSA